MVQEPVSYTHLDVYKRQNSECMGILSIRSINKELYSGNFKVLDIKDLVMFREFDFVQLQGQDTGLPTCLLYTSLFHLRGVPAEK